MECEKCPASAVISPPALCRDHFIGSFEERVRKTVDCFSLVREGQRIAVAASGGKDSLTVLHLLSKWFAGVTAIAIDEGIAGYREHTLNDLKTFCQQRKISLVIRSYQELTGHSLDEILAIRKYHPCSVCGTLRRHLLNVAAKGFDVLATGHNADDESQVVLMNLLKGNTQLFPRLGPKSGHGAKGFTQRVKPLYFVTEKEVMTYAYLQGLTTRFTECPNARGAYREVIREALNTYARENPGVRQRILERFLEAKGAYPAPGDVILEKCSSCGEPSSGGTCKACRYVLDIKMQ